MIVIETPLGNLNEPQWTTKLVGYTLDWLELDQWEAQKNRLLKSTAGGNEIALALHRGTHLHDGDILLLNAEQNTAVVARIHLKQVMVIDLSGLLPLAPLEMMQTCVELGHALGNQHWPAVVKGTQVLIPLTVDQKVMASVLKTHAFEGITVEFVPGADVIPYLAPHEARRLFGGAEVPLHSHAPQEPA